jgi:hypothetical protein
LAVDGSSLELKSSTEILVWSLGQKGFLRRAQRSMEREFHRFREQVRGVGLVVELLWAEIKNTLGIIPGYWE